MLHHPDTLAHHAHARHEHYRSHRYVGAVCEAALMLALATGLGFGVGAVIERLTSAYSAAGASVLVEADRSLPRAGRIEYIGDTALGSQHEIGPENTNDSNNRRLQPRDVSVGAAP